MTSDELRQKITADLEKIAQSEDSGYEDIPVISRTNAYEMGFHDGGAELARRLLVEFFGYDKRSDSDWSEGR